MKSFRICALVSVLAVVASCGGGNGSSTADTEFCDYLRTLEDIDPEAAPDDALAAIDDIIDRAPQGEVKGALQDLRPIFEAMTNIDPNDEAAFGEMMSLMFDPKIIAAGEVLEKYGAEVCGFEDASNDTTDTTDGGWMTDSNSGAATGSNVLPGTRRSSTPGSSQVANDQPVELEELDSSDISHAVERVLFDQDPDAYVASSGWSSMGGTFSVDVDITGIDDPDGVPLCEAVVELLKETDPDAPFEISITHDGRPIASSNLDNCLGLVR